MKKAYKAPGLAFLQLTADTEMAGQILPTASDPGNEKFADAEFDFGL